MKIYFTYLFFVCSLLLALNSCSDTSLSDSSNESTLQKVASIMNIQQGAGLQYQNALQETGDTLAALETMGKWIGEQPAVENAWYHDLESIEILHKNGLKSWIHLVPTDENGVHLTRGGGSTNGLTNFSFSPKTGTPQIEKIKNDKVLVLIPYSEQFEYTSFKIERLRDNFKKGSMEVDIYTDDQVTLNIVNSMDEYGLIILNTHGQKHGFLIGDYSITLELEENWSPDDVEQKLLAPLKIPEEKIANGEIEIIQRIDQNSERGEVSFSISVIVTENYIRNLDIDLSDVVVFGNYCYSGHTADGKTKNNMSEAWRSKNVAAYYGYAYDTGISKPVLNSFAIAMELVLIQSLVVSTDTTGVAHLNKNGLRYSFEDSRAWSNFREPRAVRLTPKRGSRRTNSPFYFNHYFETNYSYGCGTFIDPRDNQEYELACIGDQTWFGENLNYAEKGVCYDNNPENCEIYGRLYSIMEMTGGKDAEENKPVQGLCPEGWHVPSNKEWRSLFDAVGGFEVAGDSLKADAFWNRNHGDPYEFEALPGGRWTDWDGFTGVSTDAYFWTSSRSEVRPSFEVKHFRSDNSSIRTFIQIITNFETIPEMKVSGRCIKDEEE